MKRNEEEIAPEEERICGGPTNPASYPPEERNESEIEGIPESLPPQGQVENTKKKPKVTTRKFKAKSNLEVESMEEETTEIDINNAQTFPKGQGPDDKVKVDRERRELLGIRRNPNPGGLVHFCLGKGCRFCHFRSNCIECGGEGCTVCMAKYDDELAEMKKEKFF